MNLTVIHGLCGAVHVAVQQNDKAALTKVIGEKGASVVKSTVGDGITPLHIAAAKNNKNIAAFLLSVGADINARTSNGYTPLHWTAKKDASETAELLIAMGADINAQSNRGLTPLHWAAQYNALNTAKLLIISGADISIKSKTGYKPLHWSVMNEAEDVSAMLAFKEASEHETNHVRKEAGIREELDNMNWLDALKASRTVDTEPAMETLPNAVRGEDFSLPLDTDISMEFVWLEAIDAWLAKYEVTNKQYRKFNPSHSSLFREEMSMNGDEQPVVYVSWKQAKIFCTWLNRKFGNCIPAGYEFRLPTSMEWTTSARCGTQRQYPWGDSLPPLYGNYSDASARKFISDWQGVDGYDDGYTVTCDVSESGSNEWGIFGMGGNVWEWCENWYQNSYRYKVLHGGSWDYDDETMIRIDSCGFDLPETMDDTIGMRIIIAQEI